MVQKISLYWSLEGQMACWPLTPKSKMLLLDKRAQLCGSVARDERLCGGQRGSVNRYYIECLTRLWCGGVKLSPIRGQGMIPQDAPAQPACGDRVLHPTMSIFRAHTSLGSRVVRPFYSRQQLSPPLEPPTPRARVSH
ncbi:Uncharacterized protein HZ326_19579 [Fusarium oxysporum f. sp. albedinis]|nr:Uncharacterized protein HZ326_19579 [Fusarium oxysporum f. sp. albedinis]